MLIKIIKQKIPTSCFVVTVTALLFSTAIYANNLPAPAGQATTAQPQQTPPAAANAPVTNQVNPSQATPSSANPASAASAAAASNNSASQPGSTNTNLPASSGVNPDLNQSFAPNDQATAALTLDQRVARVQQQVTNLINMNQTQKIASLQVQLQQLSGQIEVLGHSLKQLDDQQRSFYKTLNQRINQIQNLDGSDSASSDAVKAAPARKPNSSGRLKNRRQGQGS